ncbi:Pentatricopeptide repeat-containing protein [Musa troglodytarum]|uniref:Pentatricopeptide repeat-containing protein n=1 Tax=Musa troglodytarum TaxID=320322 RepID=A0A9E7HGS8_9LILI|nr:Pentatricopeptide repeat-containing protein [Musa troglodytarum]
MHSPSLLSSHPALIPWPFHSAPLSTPPYSAAAWRPMSSSGRRSSISTASAASFAQRGSYLIPCDIETRYLGPQ